MNLIKDKQLLVALAKLFSDQSTRVIGELKQQQKLRFNIACNSIDSFVSEVESKMSDTDKEDMQELTDALNEFIADVREQFNNHIKNK
jgi:polyhydroxyalkanoate synthesis regulator phasin